MFNRLTNVELLFLFNIMFSSVTGSPNNGSDQELKRIISNLPVVSSLGYYLDTMKQVVNFCMRHETSIDLNLAFGLFLINVHLKPIMREKSDALPASVRDQIKDMLNDNDKILKDFDDMVSQDKDPRNIDNKLITSLFDEKSWIQRLAKFNIRLFEYQRDHPVQSYFHLKAYKDQMEDMYRWIPHPMQSDKCFASMGRNKINPSNAPVPCTVEEPCKYITVNGSGFGYPLSHRLLLLLSAKFGRGCSVFSPKKDRDLIYEFCQRAYIESDFIARNNYLFEDLIFEFIALCTIDGHAQFLQGSWLANLFRLQTRLGCFAQSFVKLRAKPVNISIMNEIPPKWVMSKNNHSILGGVCNGHVTSVATGCLAAAVRYILETYY